MTYSLPPVDIDMFVPIRTAHLTPLFMAVTKMIVIEWGRLTSNKSRSLLSPVAETPLSNPDSLPLSATPEKSSTAFCASHNENKCSIRFHFKGTKCGQMRCRPSLLTSFNDGLRSVSLTPAGATRISSSSGPHLGEKRFSSCRQVQIQS